MSGAMLFLIFILGCGALNIIVPLLWMCFCADDCIDDPDCPDSWNYKDDDEIRHIPASSSKSSQSSSSKTVDKPGEYIVGFPPNLDHPIYG